MKIKLQGQPIEILTLPRTSGDIVTREKLQKNFWPSDTFVDFEHSLNAPSNGCRDALDDSADTPATSKPSPAAAIASSAPLTASNRSQPRPRALKWWGSAASPLWPLFGGICGAKRRRLAHRIFRAGTKPIRSIAITALGKSFGRPEQDYFAEGMTEGYL